MTIACMMRVRNEARWISEVLASIKPLTENIAVFDDHSTDGTDELCVAAGAMVVKSRYEDGDTNEIRDKNFLLELTRRTWHPDYVLCIDGDEILQPGAAERIRTKLNPAYCQYTFPFKFLWNEREKYRVDGVYGRYQRSSLFSLVDQKEVTFGQSIAGAKCGFHCGNVPKGLTGQCATIHADILHLGYLHAEDRVRKYHWYNAKDPNNRFEDSYKHMVIGDLFPAESKFLHGGPLKLFTLPRYGAQAT